MPNIVTCQECSKQGSKNSAEITMRGGAIELQALMVCLSDSSHQWPIIMRHDQIWSTHGALPVSESSKLRSVPKGIVQDVKEAERAHFARCYKASVVMCRRALQLAFEKKLGAENKYLTLGPLIDMARKQKKPLLDPRTFSFVERIKDTGDGGAHGSVDIDPQEVGVVIFDTVGVLNELFDDTIKKPGEGKRQILKLNEARTI